MKVTEKTSRAGMTSRRLLSVGGGKNEVRRTTTSIGLAVQKMVHIVFAKHLLKRGVASMQVY